MVRPKGIIREYLECGAIAVVLAVLIITFVAQSFVVEGSSMEPSLHHGQRLLVNKFVYRFGPPDVGDVVVFRYPGNPSEDFIKRVVAVGGSEVEISQGHLYLDGEPLEEPYIKEPPAGEFGPVEVPEDKIFVLGDNRNNSKDSRYPDVGFLQKDEIVGRAVFIYWPPDEMEWLN